MNEEHPVKTDPRIASAVGELEALILARYPAARFDVCRGEDPDGVYLRATVDVEDSDAVLDLVLDKLYDLQVEQGLPVHVVTTVPLERVAEQVQRRTARTTIPSLPHLFQA